MKFSFNPLTLNVIVYLKEIMHRLYKKDGCRKKGIMHLIRCIIVASEMGYFPDQRHA